MVENKDICDYVLNRYCRGLVYDEHQTHTYSFAFEHISYDKFLEIQTYAASQDYYLTANALDMFITQILNLEDLYIERLLEQSYCERDILIGEVLRLYYDDSNHWVDILKVDQQEYVYVGVIPNYNKSYIRLAKDSEIGVGELYKGDGSLLMNVSQVKLLMPTLYHRRIDSFYHLSKATVFQNKSIWPLLNDIIELSYKSYKLSSDINKILEVSREDGIGIFTLLYLLKPNIYDKSN